jgi:hypothetical protein
MWSADAKRPPLHGCGAEQDKREGFRARACRVRSCAIKNKSLTRVWREYDSKYMHDQTLALDFIRRFERWKVERIGRWAYAILPFGNGTYFVLGEPSLLQVKAALDAPTGRFT